MATRWQEIKAALRAQARDPEEFDRRIAEERKKIEDRVERYKSDPKYRAQIDAHLARLDREFGNRV